ncbi:MAG TPA: alpha-amylase family glycosyl hydrolase [Candidatus Acidoferrales bacterium]|nr:alpha-amylase family glycosyl hydrolase [Candidatus Acidoferrales bacterium]
MGPPKTNRRRPRATTRPDSGRAGGGQAGGGTSTPTSIAQIDLRPPPGRTYFQSEREWREEFIYFLMVDRFHDDQPRACAPRPGRSAGVATPDDFYGGKIRGITRNLDYIAGLGCTAVWLSPVFENNPGAYHGYNINNYLSIDPRFGTKQDLIDLVTAAHAYKKNGQPHPLRIILDVVINHSGDNWAYAGQGSPDYLNDQQFPFGSWRRSDRPVPTELRNPDYYHRRGNITGSGWDNYPENQHGDLVGLKDFANDDDQAGSELINALIQAHCYWIREADIDGFRVDAVKHMGELACSRFCSGVREYAYSLGKRGFFLFGELATPNDEIIDRYIGPNTSRQDANNTVFFGLDSVLDFRLAEGNAANASLRDVLKGFADPVTLTRRLEAQRERALNRGELGRYLVTFVDNHDSFWQPGGRFANGAPDDQVIAAVGYLLCALGTPCIYYGTEQGFAGHGSDNAIREAMFDTSTPGASLLNTGCRIYKEIAKIAQVTQTTAPLRYGRMYFRQISGDGVHFGFPFGFSYTLAFSRILYGREVLVAYNVAGQPRNDRVIVDASLHQPGDTLRYLYGNSGKVPVERAPDGSMFVRVPLASNQFVVLE